MMCDGRGFPGRVKCGGTQHDWHLLQLNSLFQKIDGPGCSVHAAPGTGSRGPAQQKHCIL